MRRVKLINIGCKVNFAETSTLKTKLQEKGFVITDKYSDAEIVLINTCTVTNNADADCRAAIRRAKRETNGAFVGVFGCFAQLYYEQLAEMPEVNAVYGIKEKFLIPELLQTHFQKSTKSIEVSELTSLSFDFAYSADNAARSRCFLKIQDGCNYRCTYCTIPNARGNPRSIPFEQLPEIFNEVAEKGFREIVLSGINLGEYNSNNFYDFEDVLQLIAENDFGVRFRISSIEPNLINDKIIDYVCNSDTICKHLHIPLQSGSDKILKLMRRRYTSDKLFNDIHKIKSINSDVCIGLDVITGFPGETEQDFKQTYDFIDNLPASYLHVFTYSERKNTPAANFPDKVPMKTRKERTHSLKQLSHSKLLAFYQTQIGKIHEFLPEKYSESEKIHLGHTSNYLNCKVITEKRLDNSFFYVQINEIDKDDKIIATLK
ncbi:MAG TPA: tRNA (N(6)-L-threonylcarbamoyladenosine(37)-C(2))-methylthiotransferase MtaB [Candidatus Kapabacteria bacterium]|jgi:threonylcarbamoyladenosine tRNA methylthiotransferase MtaB|nr:tRNA (N(6)-L-threonylcarbamoyladenosine(37)-C(2))-methylthiotransferase MtaB [Candidatus Kapabacteria bacterium]